MKYAISRRLREDVPRLPLVRVWHPKLDLAVGVRAVAPDHAPDGRQPSRTPSFEHERPADDVAEFDVGVERIAEAHEQCHVARHFAEFALAAGVHPAGETGHVEAEFRAQSPEQGVELEAEAAAAAFDDLFGEAG